ncbi:MAG: tetratricopeptide repeat protein [Nitrospirae bacterium]|nr:tetratricopeptide repeat protein [Nitrospirota bacterium]
MLLNRDAINGAGAFPRKRLRRFRISTSSFPSNYCLIMLCAAILSACASTEDVGKAQFRLNNLEKDVLELKKTSQAMEKEMPKSQKDFLKQLEAARDSQEATARAVSNLFTKVQEMSADIQKLTGKIDEFQHLNEKGIKEEAVKRNALATEISGLEILSEDIKKQIEEIKAGMEALRAELELMKNEPQRGDSKKSPSQKKTMKNAEAEKTGEASAEKPAVKDVYDSAYKLYESGNYKDARAEFESVVGDYEKNEFTVDSKFWIAESFFMEKQYENAILAYDEILKNFPDSDKIPASKLMQGLAFYELKDTETAEYILKNLIELFPDSPEAATARNTLGTVASPETKK